MGDRAARGRSRARSSGPCRSRATPSPTASSTAARPWCSPRRLGSVGAAIHAYSVGKLSVGVDINATHHRAAKSGLVTGVATAAQPRPLDRVVRSGDQRRPRQARVYVANHLCADPTPRRSAARPYRAPLCVRARTTGGDHVAEVAPVRHGVGRRPLRPQLAPQVVGRVTRQHGLRAERQPGHEPVGVARARHGGAGDLSDADLLGEGDRALDQRRTDPVPAVLRQHLRREGVDHPLQIERGHRGGGQQDRAREHTVELGDHDPLPSGRSAASMISSRSPRWSACGPRMSSGHRLAN